jgi:hypothetical protein
MCCMTPPHRLSSLEPLPCDICKADKYFIQSVRGVNVAAWQGRGKWQKAQGKRQRVDSGEQRVREQTSSELAKFAMAWLLAFSSCQKMLVARGLDCDWGHRGRHMDEINQRTSTLKLLSRLSCRRAPSGLVSCSSTIAQALQLPAGWARLLSS